MGEAAIGRGGLLKAFACVAALASFYMGLVGIAYWAGGACSRVEHALVGKPIPVADQFRELARRIDAIADVVGDTTRQAQVNDKALDSIDEQIRRIEAELAGVAR